MSPAARRRGPAGKARVVPGPPGRRSGGWRARAGLLAVLVAGLLVAGAGSAGAHPLGNFTVSSSSGLRVGPDRLDVDYVVDMAEIPTFQTRQAIDADQDGKLAPPEAATWRTRECPRLARGLRATVDGRPLTLAATASTLTFPEGAGGLETLRLECTLAASLPAAGNAARALTYTDTNQEGRVGWREITAVGDRTILDTSDVPAVSPTDRLTTYPEDQLNSPLDRRTASLRFTPGGPARGNPAARCEAPRRGNLAEPGTGCPALSTGPAGGPGASAPDGTGGGDRGTAPSGRGGVDRATAAFTALVGGRSLSPGFAVVALLVAVGLGAAHALAPGHGKTVMAAYLVGLRGTLGQAATIGATVTVTHTAGVLVLGLVLTTSRAFASERVYPWLGLASGLLLAAVGIGLLVRARTGHHHPHGNGQERQHGHHHGQDHLHPHEQEHPRSHPHGQDRLHPHGRGHAHPHADPIPHAGPRPLGRRGLVALGLAGGLVPSPSAVVVLLGGIALGQVWFGVALVLAYGVGMAATLTGIGLLLAHLRSRMDRRLQLPAGSILARAGRLLPAATASVIVVVGLALAANGAAQL